MAVSPFKTFVAGEILTAADLNASFAQVFDNGELLAWPATVTRDFDGNELILDGDGDTSIHASTDDQIDYKLLSADSFRMLLEGGVPDFRAISTDAGAAAAPFISVVRDSASPADDDVLGALRFLGENDASEETAFGSIGAEAADVTDGTEDGRISFTIMKSGTATKVGEFGGGSVLKLLSDVADAAADPKLQLTRSSASPADDDILGQIDFRAANSVATIFSFASIEAVADDVTDTTEDGSLRIKSPLAGSDTTLAKFGPGGVSVGAPTGGVPATVGHLNAEALFDDNVQVHALAAGPAALQTMAADAVPIDFTGIGADARRITVMCNGVSTDGSEEVIIQLGDSGGFETSGYVGTIVSTNWADSGAPLNSAGGAAEIYTGMVILTLMDSATNTWCIFGNVANSNGPEVQSLAGIKPLSSVLTQLRITTTGTPDTWDGGSVSVLVE